MTTTTGPDTDLVQAALEQVWESMLYAVAEPVPSTTGALANGLEATIAVSGAWNGELRLFCDAGAAQQMAATMLGAPSDEELPELDVHDAVGEILNVVGGSVKGALEGESRLGLPQVRPATSLPDPADCVAVSWRGAPVYVQIVSLPA
jgi:hypothetical protein